MTDPRSQGVIETLLPKVRPVFTEFLSALQDHFHSSGVTVKIISGNRTWEEQDALYAQGRTTPGKRVTNAKGGQSNHNFGIAVDIGLFLEREYLEDSPLYNEIGGVVAQFPQLEWGGSWKSIVDLPHVQWSTGMTVAELREKVLSGQHIV